MEQLLAYTIIGLTTGAIYAVAASGLVVTYATSGIFNIAHGAVGMVAAFAYWQLRFDWGWPAPIALAVVLLVLCPLGGALIERFILRGLENTSEVIKLTVTVGLLAAFIGLANWAWPPEDRVRFRGFFDGSDVSIGGINVSYHKLIAFATAVGVAVLLRFFLYRTRPGVAMRAIVDDRGLAELNGTRTGRISMLAWAGSASLGGLAGILLAAEVGLNVIPLTLLVINAYAAAIFGRLRSLPLTFLGAMVLGVSEAYLLWANGTSWWPQTIGGFSTTGVRAAFPTILLFIVLLWLPQERLRVGARRIREAAFTPTWRHSALGAVLLVGFTWAVSGMLTRQNMLYAVDGFILALAALSLVPLTGYAGQLSLAPLTFAGLGAVCMSKLPGHGSALSLVATVVIVAAIGALVALPAVRLQGIYLALLTGAFAVLVTTLVFNQGRVFSNGSVDVPALDIPGVDLTQPRPKLVFLAIAFSVVGLAVVALRRSQLGRSMVAMKDSPIASATLGLNLTRMKLITFMISAGIASLAGALDSGKVSPDQYQFSASLPVVLLAVVGGVATVSGALLGGMLLAANTVLAIIVPAFSNLSKVMPGLVGISLGRNPDGASVQTARAYRPVGEHLPSLVVAVVGGAVLTWLGFAEVISHWGFAVAIAVWVLGVVPNLPAVLRARGSRLAIAIAVLVVALALAMGFDWDGSTAAAGWRIVAGLVLAFVAGSVARRALDTTPRIALESPDAMGLTRPFTDTEIEQAERALGVTL